MVIFQSARLKLKGMNTETFTNQVNSTCILNQAKYTIYSTCLNNGHKLGLFASLLFRLLLPRLLLLQAACIAKKANSPRSKRGTLFVAALYFSRTYIFLTMIYRVFTTSRFALRNVAVLILQLGSRQGTYS